MNDYIAYLQLEREELIHGGPGSGRYPAGSGERPNQHRGGKLNTRVSNRMARFDRKIARKQRRASKFYEKAQRREHRIFATEGSVARAYRKANKAQRKVNKWEYKGKRTYEQYLKKASRINIDTNPEIVSRGEEYIKRVNENSRIMYMKYAA